MPCDPTWRAWHYRLRKDAKGFKDLLATHIRTKTTIICRTMPGKLIVLADSTSGLADVDQCDERSDRGRNRATKRVSGFKRFRKNMGLLAHLRLPPRYQIPKSSDPGRDFVAWIGLVHARQCRQVESRTWPDLMQGDRYLRRLLVVGADSVLRRAKLHPGKFPWITQMLARRQF